MAPFQLFATSDDWVVVACAKEKFWRKLVRGLDIEELRDPIFSSFALRYENFERLSVLLGEAFGQRTSAEWVAVLDEWGVPASRVNTVVEALQDPQVDARDMIVEVEHQEFGRVRMPAVAVKVGRARKHHKAAPPLGEVSSQPPWVQSVVDEHRR
jgi:crotonobetainyl-CoA:carnitine CoA-transferase CaiB-like acyl-CoA transferase